VIAKGGCPDGALLRQVARTSTVLDFVGHRFHPTDQSLTQSHPVRGRTGLWSS
jgi:hypothetical protein